MTVVKQTLDRWYARWSDLITHSFMRPVVRGLRTWAQTFLGVYSAIVFGKSGEVANLAAWADLDVIQAANAAGLSALVAWIQNALESNRVPGQIE